MTIELPRSPTARVSAAYRKIAEADRPEVWITLREQADVLVDAGAVEQRLAAGESLLLAGLLVAAKVAEKAIKAADLYIHAPRGRTGRHIDDKTEQFVDATRMGATQ